MSDLSDPLDQQIAALEDALQLPLPAATRAQVEQDLRALRSQRAAQRAGAGAAPIQGTTNVSGTLHGAAIGVNLGTAQISFGAPLSAPGGAPGAAGSSEQIDDQRARLEAHRRTLATYLQQRAMLGRAHAPPGVEQGIREARAAIGRITATLLGWGVTVPAHPDDTEEA